MDTDTACDGLSVIRDEHRRLAAVLTLLKSEAGACLELGREPDPELFSRAFDYVDGFLNTQHHPKENLYLFAELRQVRPDMEGIIEKLEGQHRDGAVVLARARAAVQGYLTERDRVEFHAAIERYCQFEFDHMRIEEEHIIPAAAESLGENARTLMDRAFVENHLDPLFGGERKAHFERLFHAIRELSKPGTGEPLWPAIP